MRLKLKAIEFEVIDLSGEEEDDGYTAIVLDTYQYNK